MGVGREDLQVQSWNCNSLKKSKSLGFSSNENVFILVDTRFGPQQEREFEKLWDGPLFFNSFNSNQRGLMVLFRDSLPIRNVKVENILKGDYM